MGNLTDPVNHGSGPFVPLAELIELCLLSYTCAPRRALLNLRRVMGRGLRQVARARDASVARVRK